MKFVALNQCNYGRTPSGELIWNLCMSILSSTQETQEGEEILVSYGKS